MNVEWLAPDKLKERFPSMHVADLGAAVQSHDDGWLDPYAVLMGFRRKVKSLGVELSMTRSWGSSAKAGLCVPSR